MSWVLGAGKTTPPARSVATTSATPAMSGSAENAAAQDWSRASTWSRTGPGHSSVDSDSAKSLWQTRSRKGRRQFLAQVSSRVRVNRAVLLFLPMHWCSLENRKHTFTIYSSICLHLFLIAFTASVGPSSVWLMMSQISMLRAQSSVSSSSLVASNICNTMQFSQCVPAP